MQMSYRSPCLELVPMMGLSLRESMLSFLKVKN